MLASEVKWLRAFPLTHPTFVLLTHVLLCIVYLKLCALCSDVLDGAYCASLPA